MPFRYSLNSIILGSPRSTHMRIGKDLPAELRADFFQAALLYYWEGTANGYFYEGIRRDPASPFSTATIERGYVSYAVDPPVKYPHNTMSISANADPGKVPILTMGSGYSRYLNAHAMTFTDEASFTVIRPAYADIDDFTSAGMTHKSSGSVTGDFSWTATSYGATVTAGTYSNCGTTFVMPWSQKITVHMRSLLLNSAVGNITFMAPRIREGNSIGSGAVIYDPSDNYALSSGFTSATPGQARVSGAICLEGLAGTPGDTFNIRLEHRVNAGTGRTLMREIIVIPSP